MLDLLVELDSPSIGQDPYIKEEVETTITEDVLYRRWFQTTDTCTVQLQVDQFPLQQPETVLLTQEVEEDIVIL